MDLNYKITTTAELAGAQAAEAALDREIGKAKALGNEFVEQAKKRDLIRASIAAYNADLTKQSALEAEAAARKTAMEADIAARVQAGGDARKRIQNEIAQGVHTVTQEELDAATATADVDAAAVTSKIEIRQALRALGMEFPMLSRIARVAMSGVGAAFAGVTAAIGAWAARIRYASEELERMEMPDFQIEQVHQASIAWDGLAKARAAADAAFNSGSAIYARAITDLREILQLQKEQLEAEKKSALAKLELKKSEMMPEAYDAAKKQIEDVFAATEKKNTQAEKQKEIARKQEEAANLEISARNKAAAAARLPQADEAHDKAATDAHTKWESDQATKIEAQKKEVKFLEHMAEVNKTGPTSAGDVKDVFEYGLKYGGATDPEKELTKQRAAQALMEEEQASQRAIFDRRAKQIKERDRLQKESEDEAGKARTIRNELPIDQASHDRQYGKEKPYDPPNYLPENFIDTRTSGERAQDNLKRRLGKTAGSDYSWGDQATPTPQAAPVHPMPEAMTRYPDVSNTAAQKQIADLTGILHNLYATLSTPNPEIEDLKTKFRDLAGQVKHNQIP